MRWKNIDKNIVELKDLVSVIGIQLKIKEGVLFEELELQEDLKSCLKSSP